MQRQPDVTGDWSDGLDKSPNRIQMAPAAQTPGAPPVIALRSTFEPDAVITATPAQVLQLAQAIQEGSGFGHLIKQ